MSKKRRKRSKKTNQCCETCGNLIPIGEGDHICIEGKKPHAVLCEYQPTEEYFWCGGLMYCEEV